MIINNKNTNTITSPNTTINAEPKIAPNIAMLTNAKIAVNTNNVNKIIIVPPYNKKYQYVLIKEVVFYAKRKKPRLL